MGTRLTLTDFTNGAERWELGHATNEIMRGLPEIAVTKTERSAASGDPVDSATLREAAGYSECNADYPQWSKSVAAIGSANCPEARQIAHEFSEGKLDRLGRYKDAPPSRYTGPEAVDQVLDTMPPGVPGGVTVGTIFDQARKNGCTVNPHVGAPPSERFKAAIANLNAASDLETVVQPSIDQDQYGWRFDTFDAAEDAHLPPITYHDENKLWPKIPGGSLTQIIAQAKGYKTTFYLSELFRLVGRELKAESE